MCDFHSVIVTGDGRILHLARNSHSAIAEHFQLANGLDAHWWECEWDGRGNMPVQLVQTRGKGEPTGVAQRTAERHYAKLAEIVRGDLDPMTVAPFDGPEYVDVRNVYAETMALKCVDPIADMFDGLDDSTAVEIIRALAEKLSLDMCDIAESEIQSAVESAEESAGESYYDSGYEAGVEAASEDLYTFEYMQEQIDEAVEKAKEECEAEYHQQGYSEGFLAAKNGATPAPEFINGLPSFLFSV